MTKRVVTLRFDWVAWRKRMKVTQPRAAVLLGIGLTTMRVYEYKTYPAPRHIIYLALYVERYGPIERHQLDVDVQARRSNLSTRHEAHLRQIPIAAAG